MKRCTAVVFSLLAWPGVVHADMSDDDKIVLQVQLTELAAAVEAARSDAANYAPGSVPETLAAVRAETYALTAAMLEARLAAEELGTPVELTVPLVAPDSDAAARIEAEIVAQEAVVAEAEAEAAGAGAAVHADVISRVQVEKLTLARLRGALMQARYGAMIPEEIAGNASPAAISIPPPPPRPPEIEEKESAAAPVAAGPARADPDHPQIDYDAPIFRYLDGEGYAIHGWWGLLETQTNNSARIFGVQVEKTARSSGYSMTIPGLSIGCNAGTLSFIYDTDNYLLTDPDSSGLDVTYRIDGKPAVAERWSETAGGEAAALFGQDALPFLKKIRDAESIFLRVVEPNGKRHEETFTLAGVRPVVDAAEAACVSAGSEETSSPEQTSSPELTSDDYKAIQEALNAAGFDAGKPDGIWGAGSRGAMRAYQEDRGLPATGVPDADTLKELGLEF